MAYWSHISHYRKLEKSSKEKIKILFILKKREDYDQEKHIRSELQTGLYNSAQFMNKMLLELDFISHIAIVNDNNDIDREVTKFKPTHVIIEALWVVPTKFNILKKLHPNVKWIIRLHSEIPFISNEGMAMDWIGEYLKIENVTVAANSPRMLNELEIFNSNNTTYLPNFYPDISSYKKFNSDKEYIDIGCFGAIRPLKNHLIQAFAAIKFANKIGKKLRFYINTGRIEMKGEPALRNLQSLFFHLRDSGHELIIQDWSLRDNFLELCNKMDIGMQVSFSETFNIVAADFISQGVPIIVSKEIPWSSKIFCADPVNMNSIYRMLLFSYYFPQWNVNNNYKNLKEYTDETKKIWNNYLYGT